MGILMDIATVCNEQMKKINEAREAIYKAGEEAGVTLCECNMNGDIHVNAIEGLERLAKLEGQTVSVEETSLEDYPYRAYFESNGVRAFALITEEEKESLAAGKQSGDSNK